ncbi:MAG: family 10 glycosylhydrolase [Clostridiales Family XIII bacterium]|jgi:uncharacterized lipoprotein YddW (UPF0748 family)|nr:family 10 glycosylhydrolase [Clostridiales Family XIII bacterium]
MRKTAKRLCFCALAIALALSAFTCLQTPVSAAPRDEFRGVWVATVQSLNYPSQPTTDPEILRRDALRILDNAKDMGFNAVFFQVRPAADALYSSALFPWSKYLTGVQGTAPANGFDPLAFMVQAAHERGLELHAWLNPYRITAEERESGASLSANHPARLHPEWAVTHADGRMYWNPGEPGVQQLIADGVREIVNNYAVDGIHIDDYFYPDANFDDAAAFAAYGAGYPSRTEWRNANTETTVRNLYDIVRGSGKNIVFGVSPAGIWANSSTTPLGSNTRGGEALIQKFADTRGWVKRGIVDYIAPQIYWNIGYEIAEYTTLVDWWADTVAGTNVKLYIGQAAYRTGNADPNSPWHGVDEISRQLAFNRAEANVSGYIMYAYKAFEDNPALYALIKGLNDAGVQSGAATDAGTGTSGADGAAGQGGTSTDAGTGVAAVTFTDTAGHWANEAIAAVSRLGGVHGYPDGSFLPDNNVKRADFILMLMSVFGLDVEQGAAGNFTDIAPDAYYYQALASAKRAGIVTGIGADMFDPDAPLTRQDMLAMTYRALVLMGKLETSVTPSVLDGFSDRAQVATHAVAPLSAFVEKNIVTGSDTGLLEPLKPATRAETVTVLWRVYTQFGLGN